MDNGSGIINEEFAKTRDEEKVSSSENDTTTKVSNEEDY